MGFSMILLITSDYIIGKSFFTPGKIDRASRNHYLNDTEDEQEQQRFLKTDIERIRYYTGGM